MVRILLYLLSKKLKAKDLLHGIIACKISLYIYYFLFNCVIENKFPLDGYTIFFCSPPFGCGEMDLGVMTVKEYSTPLPDPHHMQFSVFSRTILFVIVVESYPFLGNAIYSKPCWVVSSILTRCLIIVTLCISFFLMFSDNKFTFFFFFFFFFFFILKRSLQNWPQLLTDGSRWISFLTWQNIAML